jgi:cyclic peptide transporter
MVLQLVMKRRWTILAAGLLSAASAFLTVATIAFLNRLASGELTARPAHVLWQGIALLALTLATSIVANRYLARFGPGTVAELRRLLSEMFLRMDYQEMSAFGQQRVTGALIMDLQHLSLLIIVLPNFFFNATLLLLCLGYLLFLSWQIFALFAAFLAVMYASSALMMKMFNRHHDRSRAEEDNLYEYFNAIRAGKKELSLNSARADHLLNELIQKSVDAARHHAEITHRWWGYNQAGTSTLHLAAMFLVIYSGASLLGLPTATVTHSFVVTMFIYGPLTFLVGAWRDIGFGLVSVRRLQSLGIGAAGRQSPLHCAAPPLPWSKISLCEVEHRYDTEQHGFALGPIDLTIERGETIFVVGGNGSGKSTLALLLTALLRPTGGRIEIDGAPLDVGNAASYRRLFSAVFFDFHLFHHVIDRDGRRPPQATFTELLRRFDLHEKVQLVDGRLTRIDLSQGQRRRLALAQSYVDDSDIFLFDEWAADQDPEYKRYFYFELLPELRSRGKTIVAITHDDRYFHCADRVVKLDQGRVVADSRSDPAREPARTPGTEEFVS